MDLISNLPDDLRCHILSFLPTKHAALTSVLSKSWLHMWKFVATLDIDDFVLLHPGEGKAKRHEIRQSFVDFVDSVLAMQGDSPIEKFSLKSITGVHPDCVSRWICNVLQRGVSDLNLRELYFTSDSELLSLCTESMPVFNNLKTLGIMSDEGRGWQAVPTLLRNCPHLEYLIIEGLLHYVTDKCGDACNCISREDKGRSLISCPVKKIKIQGFRGTMRELLIVEHFLESFRCLKEMEIFAEENRLTKFDTLGVFEYVESLLDLYNQLSSCRVYFVVSDFMRRKWTPQ